MFEILPSILTANFLSITEDIERFKKSDIKEIHFDVMDGHFVPGITFGDKFIKDFKEKYNDIKADVHLMIDNPKDQIDKFIAANADTITVHVEALKDKDIINIMTKVKAKGIKFGLAINPSTSCKRIEKILKKLPDIDQILVMSVVPGAGGQAFIEGSIKKVEYFNILRYKNNYRYEIEIDGGINNDTILEVLKSGVTRVVIGSALYKDNKIEDNIKKFSDIII